MKRILGTLGALALLFFFALFLDNTYPVWVNRIVHFLGGFFAAWLVQSFSEITPSLRGMKPLPRALFIMVPCALLLGVFWEFFEYFVMGGDMLVRYGDFGLYQDTILDLLMDVFGSVGAACMYLLFVRMRKTLPDE